MSGASELVLHLRPCPVEVTFQGRDYTIRAMDAVDWLTWLEGPRPDLYEIFPVLAGPDAIGHVEDALWAGEVDTDQVGRLGLEVISAVADRPWWVVLKVLAQARHSWDVVHVNHAAGMSLAGWLDEVWLRILTHIDDKKRAGWISGVEAPPKGWDAGVDVDAEERAFLNAMKAVMR